MLDVASKRPLGIITKMTKPNKKAEVLLGKDIGKISDNYFPIG